MMCVLVITDDYRKLIQAMHVHKFYFHKIGKIDKKFMRLIKRFIALTKFLKMIKSIKTCVLVDFK